MATEALRQDMKDKPEYSEDTEMKAQQFKELKKKLGDLTASQLKTLQGEISMTLNKKEKPLLSTEEREMLSKLFV
ncbi:TPA: hypothetical protein I7279_20050 [Vibrio parahaemolyticus]|nr:hypothetical protein [Vibrio parahaemolyticus]